MFIYFDSVLPVREQADQETVEDFAERVQREIAEELGIEATKHSNADKIEFARRRNFIKSTGSYSAIVKSYILPSILIPLPSKLQKHHFRSRIRQSNWFRHFLKSPPA